MNENLEAEKAYHNELKSNILHVSQRSNELLIYDIKSREFVGNSKCNCSKEKILEDGREMYLEAETPKGGLLWPEDIEYYHCKNNGGLYHNADEQVNLFQENIGPVIKLKETFFQRYNISYLLDLTPSGCHFLFYVEPGTDAYTQLHSIGVEQHDPFGIGNPEQSQVFNGIGRLAIYLSLMVKSYFRNNVGGKNIWMGDSESDILNLDLSWTIYNYFNRVMRTPFSVHSKNIRYGQGNVSFADVIKTVSNGGIQTTNKSIKELVMTMRDLNLALEHNKQFHCEIPVADQGLAEFVEDYKSSNLKRMLDTFDGSHDISQDEAEYILKRNQSVKEVSDIYNHPDSHNRALNPQYIKPFVAYFKDLEINNQKIDARTMANLLFTIYKQKGFCNKDEKNNDIKKNSMLERAFGWVYMFYIELSWLGKEQFALNKNTFLNSQRIQL